MQVMQWHDWSGFVHMGGYAFYIWTAFGLTLALLGWELHALKKRFASAVHGVKRGQQLKQRGQA